MRQFTEAKSYQLCHCQTNYQPNHISQQWHQMISTTDNLTVARCESAATFSLSCSVTFDWTSVKLFLSTGLQLQSKSLNVLLVLISSKPCSRSQTPFCRSDAYQQKVKKQRKCGSVLWGFECLKCMTFGFIFVPNNKLQFTWAPWWI